MSENSGEIAPVDEHHPLSGRFIPIYAEAGPPFAFGMADGLGQPFDLTSGLTWEDDDDANELYDLGVNFGQNLARLLMGAP